MTRNTVSSLKHTTKFDRSRTHLAALHDEGQSVAEQWLADWRALGRDFASYPNDARYVEPLEV